MKNFNLLQIILIFLMLVFANTCHAQTENSLKLQQKGQLTAERLQAGEDRRCVGCHEARNPLLRKSRTLGYKNQLSLLRRVHTNTSIPDEEWQGLAAYLSSEAPENIKNNGILNPKR